ncbi:hypothetical protein HMI56_004161 [Coelomomyces lativittatus]|nr:hypothetical protein HMI56_004161 [Coelomomyces lativittatus]
MHHMQTIHAARTFISQYLINNCPDAGGRVYLPKELYLKALQWGLSMTKYEASSKKSIQPSLLERGQDDLLKEFHESMTSDQSTSSSDEILRWGLIGWLDEGPPSLLLLGSMESSKKKEEEEEVMRTCFLGEYDCFVEPESESNEVALPTSDEGYSDDHNEIQKKQMQGVSNDAFPKSFTVTCSTGQQCNMDGISKLLITRFLKKFEIRHFQISGVLSSGKTVVTFENASMPVSNFMKNKNESFYIKGSPSTTMSLSFAMKPTLMMNQALLNNPFTIYDTLPKNIENTTPSLPYDLDKLSTLLNLFSASPVHTLQHPTFFISSGTSSVSTLVDKWSNFIDLKSTFPFFSSESFSNVLEEFKNYLPTLPPKSVPYLFNFFKNHWLDFIKSSQLNPGHFTKLCQLADLRNPGNRFPDARKIQRKIIMYVGPTNSGKTFAALKHFHDAESGAYCGPLRMLAKEVYEDLNKNGLLCNLLSGEEREEKLGAKFTSCTIEMLPYTRKFDVVVIDEIQMIGDLKRGWAWTDALLGALANTVILCGEESSIPLVQALCREVNEEVTVRHFQRLGPLRASGTSLNSNWCELKKGDCVIVFSRSQVFSHRKWIQSATRRKCAVLYGLLPPDCRVEQANKFNTGKCDILLATDVIGMGLNLNIQRIIITTFEKFDGTSRIMIPLTTVKQISGRAGRFGKEGNGGWVTTFHEKDYEIFISMFHEEVSTLQRAGLQPTIDQIEAFTSMLPNVKLHEILEIFKAVLQLNLENTFYSSMDEIMGNAKFLQHLDFSLRDFYLFCQGPLNTRCEIEKLFLIELGTSFSKNQPISLQKLLLSPMLPFHELIIKTYDTNSLLQFKQVEFSKELEKLEKAYKVSIFYMWLHLRFPDHPTLISSPSSCKFILDSITQAISKSLDRIV